MCTRVSFLVSASRNYVGFRNRRLISRCFVLAVVCVVGSASVVYADVPAQDILKKMAAVYNVKSFHGVVTMNQTGTTEENKPFNLSSTEEVTFKQPNLFLIKNSGQGVGGTQISAFNGKDAVNYISAHNQYMKTPSSPLPTNNGSGALLSLLGVRFDVQSGKLVNSITVAGKAAYVVQVLPPVPTLPPNSPAEAKTQQKQLRKMLTPYELTIDKNNYHLLRMTQTMSAFKMTKTLELTQQTLNPNLADGAFDFTPPSGAKMVTRRPLDAGVSSGNNSKGKPGAARVSQGNGSPVPPPHASPGPNGTPHKP